MKPAPDDRHIIIPRSVEMGWDIDRLQEAFKAHQAGDYASATNTYNELWQKYEQDSLGSQVVYLMALVAYEQRDIDRAVSLMSFVADVRAPLYPAAHYNLGCFHNEREEMVEAGRRFRRAAELDPTMTEAHVNLGTVALALGQVDEALGHFADARRYSPQSPEARYNNAIGLLLVGQYGKGWADYEARWDMPMWINEHGRTDFPENGRWDGRRLHGKTVVVAHEQGYGDTIMMLRYDPIIRERKLGKVVWLVQPALKRYVQHRCPESVVVCGFDPLPDWDYWTTVMSLPHCCGTKTPGEVPKP